MKSILVVIAFVAFLNCPANGAGNSTCNMEMFGNDFNAYMACQTQYALQSNWFPSPIAGLFSYLIWNGYDGFWQNGALLETMANFMVYANHTRYMSVLQGSQRDLYSLLEAYGPYPSFDDMAWYGLSYARIYEALGFDGFFQPAVDIFNWCWETGWDHNNTCGGGMWFDNNFNAKQTITNVQMYLLGAKLYRLTNDSGIFHKLKKIERFIFNNTLVNDKTYLLSEGHNETMCAGDNVYGLTYTSGVFIGALAEMYKLTGKETYLDLANKNAKATIKYNTNVTGIFMERCCEPNNCDDDEKMFKGIFARYLRYLMSVLKDNETLNEYQTWMDFNARANVKYNMCDEIPISKCNITFKDGPPYFNVSGPVFSPNWNGPFTVGAPMQQTSALDLFVAGIKPGTSCKGQFCNYDPSYPQPQPITCGSHPCPQDEECCEYSPYTSYTCCESTQKCNKQGICI